MAEYRLEIPAPCEWLNLNDRLHWGRKAERAATWRHAAYVHARNAKLPKGLKRVRIDVTARFPNRRHRDASNLHPTVKALVDGITSAPNGMSYGLVPGDTAEFLDGPYIDIGPLWPKPHSYGLVELTITDLSREVP